MRSALTKPLGEFDPSNPRHTHVAQQNVDVTGVLVKGNVISFDSKYMGYADTYGIVIRNASGVRIENLTMKSNEANIAAGVLIEKTVDSSDAGVTILKCQINLREGAQNIVDRR